jgi:hypothetical protein
VAPNCTDAFCIAGSKAAIPTVKETSASLDVEFSRKVRRLFGFEPADWLFLAGGIALAAVIAAVLGL